MSPRGAPWRGRWARWGRRARWRGAQVFATPGSVQVRREGPIRSTNVETSPYPGFPTDVQAQFMAYMCLGDGFSIIRESICENRVMPVAGVRRVGARIDRPGNTA